MDISHTVQANVFFFFIVVMSCEHHVNITLLQPFGNTCTVVDSIEEWHRERDEMAEASMVILLEGVARGTLFFTTWPVLRLKTGRFKVLFTSFFVHDKACLGDEAVAKICWEGRCALLCRAELHGVE